MIKRRFIYIYFIGLLQCCVSCNTYRTHYGITHTTITQKKSSSIKRLDLSNQQLTSLPHKIEHIKDLRMLDLSNNPNLNLDNAFKSLSRFEHLEVLILDQLSLKTLPESISSLKHLKHISLRENPNLQLEKVLQSLSKLKLEFLNLGKNNIQKLPENITDLQYLKDLNLSYNQLKGEQNYILLGKLPELYSVWLDHNNLNTLEESIGNLSQIRFLYIDHNELIHLPTAMTNMKRLWVLHASYNNFKELPSVFTQMKALLMVHVNNNMITHIPEAYQNEKYPLAGLILDNNPIEKEEKVKAQKLFKSFFLLSFEQN